MTARPKVIIIGAGFGGIFAAKTLQGKNVDVLLIDRQNFHTFTPLLYQVATAGLEPEGIAYPVRGIFRRSNITFLLGEVKEIDTEQRRVLVETDGVSRVETYDYLLVAAGSVTNYFGNQQVEQRSFDLKTLADGVTLRNHILKLMEYADWTNDRDYRQALATIVVIGGGPTGIETAGAYFELFQHVLRHEYNALREVTPRVILVEATDRLLAPYPKNLQRSALKQLEAIGVEVILNNPLEEAGEGFVRLKDGTILPTYTLIWSAGVKASPLGEMLGVPLKRGGRVPVLPTMQLETRDDVYVAGDMAYLENEQGQPYPMLIPVAKQQAIRAAKNILARIESEEQQPFRYFDRGTMATIGRSRAVAWIFNRIPLTGYLAWASWLVLHLMVLMGFRNRLAVMINWVWNYFTYDRSIRVILEQNDRQTPKPEPAPAIVERQPVSIQ